MIRTGFTVRAVLLAFVTGLALSIGTLVATPTNVYAADLDTTKLEQTIDSIPDDLSLFTEQSVDTLEKACAKVNMDDPDLEQRDIDNWAIEIEFAITGLTYAKTTAVGTKTYDGTNSVPIHVNHFRGTFYRDELFGDATATIASSNAGTYSICDWSDMQFGGNDLGWYDVSALVNSKNVNADITITKANVKLKIVLPKNVKAGEEFQVEAIIVNDFGNEAGLPTASQMKFASQHAKLKSGSVTKEGATYTATMVADKDFDGDKLSVNVSVSSDAQNYLSESSTTKSTSFVAAPASADDKTASQTKKTATDDNSSSNLAKTDDATPFALILALAIVSLVGAATIRSALKRIGS